MTRSDHHGHRAEEAIDHRIERSIKHRPRIGVRQHGPLTFNGISVLMLDLTADVTFQTPVDDALWNLVAAERLVFTFDAPILFRLVDSSD